jgi:hypothetical protein
MEVLYLSMIDMDRYRPPLMNGLLARVSQVDLSSTLRYSR